MYVKKEIKITASVEQVFRAVAVLEMIRYAGSGNGIFEVMVGVLVLVAWGGFLLILHN